MDTHVDQWVEYNKLTTEGNKYDMICKYNVIYMYIKLFLHYHTLHCHLLRTVLF